jgi:hypothetical protein
MHIGRIFQTLRIHYNTQCGRKETYFVQKINGTTILINEVSKMDIFIIIILGNMRKFYRVFLRHYKKIKKKKKNLPLAVRG